MTTKIKFFVLFTLSNCECCSSTKGKVVPWSGSRAVVVAFRFRHSVLRKVMEKTIQKFIFFFQSFPNVLVARADCPKKGNMVPFHQIYICASVPLELNSEFPILKIFFKKKGNIVPQRLCLSLYLLLDFQPKVMYSGAA